MKKRFLFASLLALALAGCINEEGKDKVNEEGKDGVTEGSNLSGSSDGSSSIEEAKDHFVFSNYIENLYADDLNGKQISMEYYRYADDTGKVAEDVEYYRKDILRIGKTQDASGVLTYDFEASQYDNSIPKVTNVATITMKYDGTTFTATHPSLKGFEFDSSAEIDLETARDYYENYSYKESTNTRFADILMQYLDYFNTPIEDVKETADGYTGIHKGQFEFIQGGNEGDVGNMTFQVSLDKEYNLTGIKGVMSYDGSILDETTITVTDFK